MKGGYNIPTRIKADVQILYISLLFIIEHIWKTLGKLDLVTREEFDVQTEVLMNTRKQIKQLEERIETLESSLSSSATK